MSKHHHQTREEQIKSRIHDKQQFQQENMSYQESKSLKFADMKNLKKESSAHGAE